MNQIPEVLNAMRVYADGNDNCLGIADVTMPKIASLTQTITGVGMAGEVEAPILGQFKSMETVINWRIPTKENIGMSGGNTVALEVRGALQHWDSSKNEYAIPAVRAVIRGRNKEFDLGKFQGGNPTDSSNTIETTYIKVEIGGETVLEIDKYAYKYTYRGKDMLKDIRDALGLP